MWLFQSVCAVVCRVKFIQCAKLTCRCELVTDYKSPSSINSNKYSFGLHTAVDQTQTQIHTFRISTMNMKVCCVYASIDRMSRGYWYAYRSGEKNQVPQVDKVPKRIVVLCTFDILALRNIYTCVVNQLTNTDKIYINIHLNISVAFVTIIRVLYKNTIFFLKQYDDGRKSDGNM